MTSTEMKRLYAFIMSSVTALFAIPLLVLFGWSVAGPIILVGTALIASYDPH